MLWLTTQMALPGQRSGGGRKRGLKSYAKPRLEGVLRPSLWDCSMEAYERSRRNAALDHLPRTPHAIWLASTNRTGALRASARRLDLMGRAMRWSFHRFLTRTWYDPFTSRILTSGGTFNFCKVLRVTSEAT